jgi:hypothetical protein
MDFIGAIGAERVIAVDRLAQRIEKVCSGGNYSNGEVTMALVTVLTAHAAVSPLDEPSLRVFGEEIGELIWRLAMATRVEDGTV